MPMVTLQGALTDHAQQIFQTALEPRLWFVPNKAHVAASGSVFADVEHQATWLDRSVGTFEVTVYSQPDDPDIWYTMRLDWLQPGQESEPPERRARGFVEWPQRIYPDTGGTVGDLVERVVGVGMVYIGANVSAAMNPVPRYQLAYNPETNWVYKRVISW